MIIKTCFSLIDYPTKTTAVNLTLIAMIIFNPATLLSVSLQKES